MFSLHGTSYLLACMAQRAHLFLQRIAGKLHMTRQSSLTRIAHELFYACRKEHVPRAKVFWHVGHLVMFFTSFSRFALQWK